MSSSQQPPTTMSSKSYTTSYSTYTSNKTVSKNGRPQSSETFETSNSSITGDPTTPTTMGQFEDNFEELKRSVMSGDAYKRSQRIHHDVLPKHGQPHYKPQEGVTVIRPTRAIPLNTDVTDNAAAKEPRTQRQLSSSSSASSSSSRASPKMSNYKTELYIPVKRHHGDFDDFFKSRWLEHNNTAMDAEFDKRRMDWDMKLDDLKRDFFHFSPFSDHHPQIDSASTIKPGPSGNPEFAVRFDVKDFKPEEINVSTKSGKLTISAAHEEKTGNSTSRREFKRTVDVPSDVQISLMRSTLSRDGILSITAPIRPPNYLPGTSSALQSNSLVTQQHANALSTMPSTTVVTKQSNAGDALNYSLSIAGYKPEEVSVSVEGRKVIVKAKHEENSGGRKVHNEMTKSFDLPPSVDSHHVRSYIKDGNTLYIEAQLRDDLAGKIHLVPVTHKYVR